MAMPAAEFSLNPGNYGLPTRTELVEHRIWDGHYHGFLEGLASHRKTMFYVERFGIERVIALDIAGGLGAWAPVAPYQVAENEERAILEKESERISGIVWIDPANPEQSCAKIEKWIRHGPCIGIKYVLGSKGITCSHPNSDPIIRLCRELNAVIYIHTWIKVGGTPRHPAGGNSAGESTPMDVAILAKRFPDVPMICGHSGGDWELGVRAIRPHENVYFEFSGSDAHSGEVDYAVSELGVDRIVWGGHGPSRSYATELGKVFDSNLNQADRMKVLGGNWRHMAAPIFKKKGYPITL